MIRLMDLSAEFWRQYFGTGSAITAYDYTLDRVLWYWNDSKRLVVCCDSPKNFRRDIDPEYKANRKPRPAEAIDAIQSVQHALVRMGCPIAQADGFEADDVIATLAKQAFPEDVTIIGDEKDLCALISDHVTLFGRRGAISFAACQEKWGVSPSQMTEFLALVGDAADNVKGCDGLGPMRAAAMLERFGTIEMAKDATDDELLKLPKFGPKTLASFRAWDPAQALSLVTLRTDAPVNLWELIPDEQAG